MPRTSLYLIHPKQFVLMPGWIPTLIWLYSKMCCISEHYRNLNCTVHAFCVTMAHHCPLLARLSIRGMYQNHFHRTYYFLKLCTDFTMKDCVMSFMTIVQMSPNTNKCDQLNITNQVPLIRSITKQRPCTKVVNYLSCEITLPWPQTAGTPTESPPQRGDLICTVVGPVYCHLVQKEKHLH